MVGRVTGDDVGRREARSYIDQIWILASCTYPDRVEVRDRTVGNSTSDCQEPAKVARSVRCSSHVEARVLPGTKVDSVRSSGRWTAEVAEGEKDDGLRGRSVCLQSTC